jgi:hypothetical protein
MWYSERSRRRLRISFTGPVHLLHLSSVKEALLAAKKRSNCLKSIAARRSANPIRQTWWDDPVPLINYPDYYVYKTIEKVSSVCIRVGRSLIKFQQLMLGALKLSHMEQVSRMVHMWRFSHPEDVQTSLRSMRARDAWWV